MTWSVTKTYLIKEGVYGAMHTKHFDENTNIQLVIKEKEAVLRELPEIGVKPRL